VTVSVDHLACKLNQFFVSSRLGDESDSRLSIICGIVVSIAQHEYRHFGLSVVQLCNECGPSQAGQVVSGDYKAEPAGKIWFFNQAQSFCRVRYPDHISESLLQRRHPNKGL